MLFLQLLYLIVSMKQKPKDFVNRDSFQQPYVVWIVKVPSMVFTSIENWPYMIIHPRSMPVDSTPILLAFLQSGPGHYSLVTKKEVSSVNASHDLVSDSHDMQVQVDKSCRCGRGRNAGNKEKLNCSMLSHYSSRCPCLRSRKRCTTLCKCQSCENPYGSRSTELETLQPRKNAPNTWNIHELSRHTGINFMKRCSEQPLAGKWTPIEQYTTCLLRLFITVNRKDRGWTMWKMYMNCMMSLLRTTTCLFPYQQNPKLK